jgi:hypothetical protein
MVRVCLRTLWRRQPQRLWNPTIPIRPSHFAHYFTVKRKLILYSRFSVLSLSKPLHWLSDKHLRATSKTGKPENERLSVIDPWENERWANSKPQINERLKTLKTFDFCPNYVQNSASENLVAMTPVATAWIRRNILGAMTRGKNQLVMWRGTGSCLYLWWP